MSDNSHVFYLVHSAKVFMRKLKLDRGIEDEEEEEEEEEENYRSRSMCQVRGMHENAGQHAKSMSFDSSSLERTDDDWIIGSQGSRPLNDKPLERHQIGFAFNKNDKVSGLRLSNDEAAAAKEAKDRQASASIFGEQSRLEPMSAERKARWRKEIDWLLCVTDYIVEFVASQQKSKNGVDMEIMVTRQRTDLHINIPALRKLDAMLIDCLDNFKDQNEFYYMSRDDDDSDKGKAKRKDDKWWLPTPQVPKEGLSEMSRKFLQYQKDCVNQVLKAAMAINAQVLSEMEIPENYIESLPKNGRASLGDSIYKSITVEFFDPGQFLSTMDLSSEHKILDLKNRIEASIVIWRRKMNQKDGKSGWGSAVSLEKRELFEERAETILLLLKHQFPGTPQSALDISKIQYNRDVGQAVLESYSRILESLAFTVLSRIEDVLYADYITQNPSHAACGRIPLIESPPTTGTDMFPVQEVNKEAPMTLSDVMGWGLDKGDAESKVSIEYSDEVSKGM
ncbi:hypothetical protein I3842_01G237400 [Carya illinoinensis]|uniref:PRONE domain-containing protein n=1 Tax=Carya illinoinensis TaxID=32201 RepID=A0A922G780_CARIL|nr:hypothetical protein I3842_01G237400 [Carya illinoinensis]